MRAPHPSTPAGWRVLADTPRTEAAPGIDQQFLHDGAQIYRFGPGVRLPVRDHHQQIELLYIVAGSLDLDPQGTALVVRAGAWVEAAPGTWHQPCAGPAGCTILALYPLAWQPA